MTTPARGCETCRHCWLDADSKAPMCAHPDRTFGFCGPGFDSIDPEILPGRPDFEMWQPLPDGQTPPLVKNAMLQFVQELMR